MTTFKTVEEKCAVCGKTSKHRVMTSTSAFGSSTLDTRPADPQGYSINLWVQRCPAYGYCVPDISENLRGAADIVKTEAYKHQLNNPDGKGDDVNGGLGDAGGARRHLVIF